MSKELRICPGVGARKCGAFLARIDRDPHPTCTRCRGKVCTRDMTCDFCAVWSAEQWALFSKKRSYKERKSRPSGSAPPAQQTSPRAETSSGVSRPGTSSASSSRPLGGQGKPEGSRGAPGVVSGRASSPPARLGRARGVEVLLGSCLAWAGSLPPLLCLRAVECGSCPLSTDFPFPCLRVCGLSLILTACSTT